MVELKIKKIEKNVNYVLENKSGGEIPIVLEFHDCENPEVGDVLIFNKEPKKNQFYAFGSLESGFGRKIIDGKDEDLLCIMRNSKKTILKRIYG